MSQNVIWRYRLSTQRQDSRQRIFEACKEASEGELINSIKLEENICQKAKSESEYNQIVSNLLHVLERTNSSLLPGNQNNLLCEPQFKQEGSKIKNESNNEHTIIDEIHPPANIQHPNEPKMEFPESATSASSPAGLRMRIFKCIEKMQKILSDKDEYSSKDVETCVKLKGLLQANPDMSEQDLERLEAVIGKKVKFELDEIDLKIIEEKCALADKKTADKECKNKIATMYDAEQNASNSSTSNGSTDEIVGLEKLSIGSSNNQSNYHQQSNYFVNCQNNQPAVKSNQELNNPNGTAEAPMTRIPNNILLPSTSQGQLSTKPGTLQFSNQSGPTLLDVKDCLQVTKENVPCVTTPGSITIMQQKIEQQEQTPNQPTKIEDQVKNEDKLPSGPKKIFTVPKRASLNGMLTSLTPERPQFRPPLDVSKEQKPASSISQQQPQLTKPINQIHLQPQQQFQQQPTTLQQQLQRRDFEQIIGPVLEIKKQDLLQSSIQKDIHKPPQPPPLIRQPQTSAHQQQPVRQLQPVYYQQQINQQQQVIQHQQVNQKQQFSQQQQLNQQQQVSHQLQVNQQQQVSQQQQLNQQQQVSQQQQLNQQQQVSQQLQVNQQQQVSQQQQLNQQLQVNQQQQVSQQQQLNQQQQVSQQQQLNQQQQVNQQQQLNQQQQVIQQQQLNQQQPILPSVALTNEVNPPNAEETAQQNLEKANKWRRDAKDALIKSVLRVEEMVYSKSNSEESYFRYFRSLFHHADKSLSQINEQPRNQVQEYRARTVEDLQTLLNQEPPRVVEKVTKEWKEIDSEIKQMVEKLSVYEVGTDQPSRNMNLRQDEFEDTMSSFIESFRDRID